MTGFDNGPKDGDFVRYIDALSAARASAPSQPNTAQQSTGPARFAAQSTNRQPTSTNDPAQASTPRRPRPSATQANAIANALRGNGTVGPREWGSIAALTIGVVLLIAALVGAAFNPLLFAAGAALVYWTVGRWVRRAKIGADSPLAALFASRRR